MNDVDAVARLREAKKLIETRGWTQGEFARDAEGEPVSHFEADEPDADKVACYCLTGAVFAVIGEARYFDRAFMLLSLAIDEDRDVAISVWNDEPERTKEDVIAAIDRAIEIGLARDLAWRARALGVDRLSCPSPN